MSGGGVHQTYSCAVILLAAEYFNSNTQILIWQHSMLTTEQQANALLAKHLILVNIYISRHHTFSG